MGAVKIKIGIIGFGVVGSGVYEVIRKNSGSITKKTGEPLEIKYIVDIRDFSAHSEADLFIKDFDILAADSEVKIVVETMGGLNPAYDFTKRALLSGKSVVTSNKELVATHGPELLRLAAENNVKYLFEASVGGGIPIIRPLVECLAGNEVKSICGILNGTTNYILTQMIKCGETFEAALAEAQAAGYAERNPAADVEGHDACRKIAILSSLAYGTFVDYKDIYTEGITKITLQDVAYGDAMNCSIKLVGYSEKVGDRISARVSPVFVPENNPLSTVDGVFNAILVEGDSLGDVMFYGKGAGKLPTASAVVADIIDIASGGCTMNILWDVPKKSAVMDIKETQSPYFIRTQCLDRAKITAAFGDVEFIALPDLPNEIGFTVKKMTEGEIASKIENAENVMSAIRILDME